MRKHLKDFWNYVKFLFGAETPSVEPLPFKLVVDERVPENTAFLVTEKDAVRIDLAPQADPADERMGRLLWEYMEGIGDAKILSISMWTEGKKCEHTYSRVKTSKEHAAATPAVGIHKDYVCTKCGQSFCAIVSEDASMEVKLISSVLGEAKG